MRNLSLRSIACVCALLVACGGDGGSSSPSGVSPGPGGGGGGGGGGGNGTGISPSSALALFAGDNAAPPGSNDGMGTAAHFNQPNGVATDGSGNIFVADTANHTIRRITPSGAVTTLAGAAGQTGSTDTAGGSPRFFGPESVSTDSAGNVYVGDGLNGSIRKITPAGVVTTFAGSAILHGSADGTGGAATFQLPRGVGTDSADNVYVADALNSNIRKITPAGVVTTLAGPTGSSAGNTGTTNANGTSARFNSPSGVAADSAGNVYVADTFNHTIRKITPTGDVSTFAGTALTAGAGDGTGAAAFFSFPRGLAIDGSDNLYVADFGNNAIRKITPAGVVTTIAGAAGQPGFQMGSLPGKLTGPFGVAIADTSLYIVMPNFSCVVVLTNRP